MKGDGGKGAAVELWRDVLDDLPDEDWANELRDADIHDRRDRMEIEEIIEYKATEEHRLGLNDVFHDLKMAFDGWWE